MRTARLAGAPLIGGSSRSSRRMQPSFSPAAPTSCAASTRCAASRHANRRGCLSFSARRVPANPRSARGLGPRLARDDSQWLPLRAIRAGRGGAIEGSEGLLSALEDVHRRFALRASRADLRQRLASPQSFVDLLHEIRSATARRALISATPYPLPLLCAGHPKASSQGSFVGSAPADQHQWAAGRPDYGISSSNTDGNPHDARHQRLGPDDRHGFED